MLSPEDFPRVLFITPHAFNKVTGTGITFTNLFHGWPKDRLATIHDDSLPVTTDVCERYYRLSDKEIKKVGASIINGVTGMASPASVTSISATSSPPGALQKIKHMVFGEGMPQKGILSSELKSWIEEFQPQVVYTILGSNGLMDVVEEVERQFRIPLVVHIMDDWMSGAFRSGFLAPLQRRRMKNSIRRLIAKARLRMGICDAMCVAFTERYGFPFHSFQNTVDITAVAAYSDETKQLGDPMRVVYAGSVFAYAQLFSLIDCCQVVATLADQGLNVVMDIYCPASHIAALRDRFEVHPAVHIHGPLTDDEVFFSTLSEADVLLIPANFDEATISYIRYSMPTRVPAYLASGTPILVYGPPEVAQVEYAKQAEWGCVVEKKGVGSLSNALKDLLHDPDRRAFHVQRARRTALLHHDAQTVRGEFRSAIAATL